MKTFAMLLAAAMLLTTPALADGQTAAAVVDMPDVVVERPLEPATPGGDGEVPVGPNDTVEIILPQLPETEENLDPVIQVPDGGQVIDEGMAVDIPVSIPDQQPPLADAPATVTIRHILVYTGGESVVTETRELTLGETVHLADFSCVSALNCEIIKLTSEDEPVDIEGGEQVLTLYYAFV